MKNLRKKMNEKKGFTLAELLIVVAIIAVLVAVSIPIFTSKLEKSREATDVANLRAAKAAAVATYLDDDNNAGDYYYDAVDGVLKDAATGISGYGKGTELDGGTTAMDYDATEEHTDQIITVTINADGTVNLGWQDA